MFKKKNDDFLEKNIFRLKVTNWFPDIANNHF